MSRSFQIVEDKLRETEFFLNKFCKSTYLSYETRFYFSAFVSAARSVTLAMQASLGGYAEFDVWYKQIQATLRADELAPLFVGIRNNVIHIGENPIDVVPIEHITEFMFKAFSGQSPRHLLVLPDILDKNSTTIVDASEISKRYFVSLVEVVFECYEKFKILVDAKWHYTREGFAQRGLTLEDALVELGFPPNWFRPVKNGSINEEDGWKALREKETGCLINDIFYRHLDKTIRSPDE
jgi:hypothetical protein